MSDKVALVSRELTQQADRLLDLATKDGVSPVVADGLFARYDRVVSLIASSNLIVLAAQAGLESGKAFAMAFDAYMAAENANPGSANGDVLWLSLMGCMTTMVDEASRLSARAIDKMQADADKVRAEADKARAEAGKTEADAKARLLDAAAAKRKSDEEAEATRRKSQWEGKSYIGRLFWGVG
jgi:hypothetical protein